MKKNSLILRIFGTIVSGMLMFFFVFSVRLVLLYQSDDLHLAAIISIPWAIGYFITKTFHSIYKSVWALAAMEFLIVVVILVIAKLFSIAFADIPTNLYKDASIVIGTLCISIVVNNLDWTKDLFS